MVARTAATTKRMMVMMTLTAAAAMAKAMVMVTAATSLPWLKFVRVGRWRKDGDQ